MSEGCSYSDQNWVDCPEVFSVARRSNYAFKRTAEQALRSKQTIAPQPLNAALDVLGWLEVTTMSLNNVSVSDGLF